MNSLLISDLHLTGAARDEYRWALFPWLIETCPQLDVKDNHSARLVNRLVTALLHVYRQAKLLGITVVRGNHDGLDPNCAYFKFLGQYPAITYMDHPFQKPIEGQEVLFLPHSNDPLQAWQGVEMHGADIILMHATMRGSLAENGQALDGIPPGLLATARRAKIFSGDVHVPQKVGRVEYIGAPYPVRFGDKFHGRALLSKSWRTFESIEIPSIRRVKVRADVDGMPREYANWLHKGDQVKVEVFLSPAEYGEWQRVKAQIVSECERHGIELCGLELARQDVVAVPAIRPRDTVRGIPRTPTAVLADYCAANKVAADLRAAGQEILKGVF